MTARIKRWWHLWWDELLIGVGVSIVLALIIGISWYVFQTTPARLSEGTVQDHRYTAEYTKTIHHAPLCVPSGKNTTVCIPQPDTHRQECVGGCFEIQVHGCSDDRRGDEHCRNEWITISESAYNHCQSDQLWVRNEPSCRAR